MAGRRDERFASSLRIKLDRGDGLMRNVSASGVFFVTDVPLTPGESVQFTLEFSGPEIGIVAARCAAHVVRVESQGRMNGIGAALDSIEFHRVRPPPA